MQNAERRKKEEVGRFGGLVVPACVSIALVDQATAQMPYIPPDHWGDEGVHSTGFRENKGQVRHNDGTPVQDLRYYAERSALGIYLRDKCTVSFTLAANYNDTIVPDTLYRVDMEIVGNSVDPIDLGSALGDHANYYRDTIAVEYVPAYRRVVYQEAVDSMDAHFYYGSSGPRMAIVLRPGADPDMLKLKFTGQDSLHVDWQGALRMYLDERWIRLEQAVAYQVDGSNAIIPVNWTAQYLHEQGTSTVGFMFGDYDDALPLVLQIGWPPLAATDPADDLCWGTYYGGSSKDEVECSTTDGAGNYYVAGYTLSPAESFPVALGSEVQVIGSDGYAAFLSRFDPGHVLEWTNYYGAPTGQHHAFDVVVRDDPFAIYLVGEGPEGLYTQVNGSAYMDDTPNAVGNGFIARFAQSGSLVWATYFGNVQTQVNSAAIDAQGRLLIAGRIGQEVPQPTGGQPVGAHVQAFAGGTDGFVALFDDDDDLYWTTCLGGSSTDNALAARTVGQRIVVVGHTLSSNFEPIQPGPGNAYPQAALGGGWDLYITEFDLDGALVWGTYYGNQDQEYFEGYSQAIRMNADGDLVIAANGGWNLDIVEGPGWFQENPGSVSSPQILLRFSGADRSLIWATYLPESIGNGSTAFTTTFDNIGNLYVAGTLSGQELGPVQMPGLYYQPIPHTASPFPEYATDGFIMSFTPDHWLAWSTYFGGDDYFVGVNVSMEAIRTLAWSGGKLYAAGVTIKGFGPLDSYFPLFDPENGAWYEGTFSGTQPNNAQDGFIAAFCTDVLTSVEGPPRPGPLVSSLQFLGNDQWRVSGLPNGTYQLRLFDISGRQLAQSRVMVTEARSEPFSLAGLPAGTYIALFDGPARMAHKVPVHR